MAGVGLGRSAWMGDGVGVGTRGSAAVTCCSVGRDKSGWVMANVTPTRGGVSKVVNGFPVFSAGLLAGLLTGVLAAGVGTAFATGLLSAAFCGLALTVIVRLLVDVLTVTLFTNLPKRVCATLAALSQGPR